ncbi:hypothetical protein BOTCAL_0170g00010 [Botryotinia calthae]|uniref:Uncharacterized protein n=1 Tax=Botryotinia calthae TaxID=38488 RepID=A0A4Y8D1P3_9HELO|nr:hypothetical protein BOTCAL_0170g00010 [Botryotinia calthae]
MSFDWNKKLEPDILRVIEATARFELVKIKANKIPRNKWERRYSAEVYETLKAITHRESSEEPDNPLSSYSPFKNLAAPRASNDRNHKVGATVIPPPSTRESATKPSGTSASRKPSELKRGRSKQSAASSTSRSVSQNIDPPQQIRDRSSDGENIKVAPRRSNPSLIVKLPVTSPSAFLSSTA